MDRQAAGEGKSIWRREDAPSWFRGGAHKLGNSWIGSLVGTRLTTHVGMYTDWCEEPHLCMNLCVLQSFDVLDVLEHRWSSFSKQFERAYHLVLKTGSL